MSYFLIALIIRKAASWVLFIADFAVIDAFARKLSCNCSVDRVGRAVFGKCTNNIFVAAAYDGISRRINYERSARILYLDR